MSLESSQQINTSSKEGTNNSKGTNVQVAVRCRPLNAEEKKTNQPTVITCDTENKSIKVAYGPTGKKIMKNFTFDKVFGMYSRQEEVFETVVRPIVEETLAGFNCTIFAYGQTGTGKTHTMEGDINSPEEAGIVPRAVNAILEQLEGSGTEFTIRVSFLELYNEELQDLLNASGDKKLKLCEDVKKGVVCQNLEEIAVLSANDIFDILQRGIQQRQTAATLCNKNSSRSHSIFTMKIMIKEYNVEGEEVVRHGQLNLVDLAGSECIGRSGAKNDRAREAGSINQSLLTLGRVITALVDHHQHVPYRDSKLTRLLQESLGGKAKTCIIATLSPSQAAVEETMSTLDYAYRARNIKNQPTVNQKLTKKVIMKEYFAEIEQLRNQLILTREKNGVYVSPEEFYAMENKIAAQEAQLNECEAALKQRTEDVKYLRNENEELSMTLQSTKLELADTKAELQQSIQQLDQVKQELNSTFIELKATEEAVKEYMISERELNYRLDVSNHTIAQKEREIGLLLTKIASWEDLEKKRLSDNRIYFNGFTSKQDEMMKSVSSFLSQYSQQVNRFEQELQSYQEMNSSAFDEFFNYFKAKFTSEYWSKMSESHQRLLSNSSRLDETVTTTHQSYQKMMESMGAELHAYFQENNSQMTSLSSHLTEQLLTINSMKEQLTCSNQSIVTELEAFSTKNINELDCLTNELLELRESIAKENTFFLNKYEQENQNNSKVLVQKANQIQQTLSSLLNDFIASSDQFSQSAYDRNKTYLTTSNTTLSKKFNELSAIHENISESISMANKDLSSNIQSNINILDKHSTRLIAMDQTMTSEVDASLQLIGQKRKHFSDSASHTVSFMAENSKKLCVGIASMRGQTEADFAQLGELRETMSNHLTEKITSSKSSIVKTMEATLLPAVTSTSNFVTTHNTSQTTHLSGLHDSTKSYHAAFQANVLGSSGKTPKKLTPCQPCEKVITKSLDEIKAQAKETNSALHEVSYEHVTAELARYGRGEPVEIVLPEANYPPLAALQPIAMQSLASACVSAAPTPVHPSISAGPSLSRINSVEKLVPEATAPVSSAAASENSLSINTAVPAVSGPASATSNSKIATRASRSLAKTNSFKASSSNENNANSSNLPIGHVSLRSRSASLLAAGNKKSEEPSITLDAASELDFN